MDVAMVLLVTRRRRRDVCLDDVMDLDLDDLCGCGSLYQRRDPLLGHSRGYIGTGMASVGRVGSEIEVRYELYYRTTILVGHITVM